MKRFFTQKAFTLKVLRPTSNPRSRDDIDNLQLDNFENLSQQYIYIFDGELF